MRQPLPPEVIAAMERRDKIEAIRLLRASTGLGLAVAKEAVENGYFEIRDPPPPSSKPASLTPAALRALQAGDKIGAIKIVRESSGIGLKEAKDVVDIAEASLNPGGKRMGERRLAPGQVVRTTNPIVWLLVLVATIAYAAWFLLGEP